MIKFTVITCTYNPGYTLFRTLDSVLTQCYPHVEHLIIDGVSKDGTAELVNEYISVNAEESDGHDVRFVCEKDSGLYDAMNKGLRMASGDYLIFLNAGDVFPSESTLVKVAEQLAGLSSQPGVVYGDTDLVDDNGSFVRHRRLSPPEHLTWRSFRMGMLVCHQSFYVHRSLTSLTYDQAYRYSADVDWCIRVMRECERQKLTLWNTHMVLTNYLAEGMTTANHRASLCERFRVMSAHYGFLTAVGVHLWFVLRAVLKR